MRRRFSCVYFSPFTRPPAALPSFLLAYSLRRLPPALFIFFFLRGTQRRETFIKNIIIRDVRAARSFFRRHSLPPPSLLGDTSERTGRETGSPTEIRYIKITQKNETAEGRGRGGKEQQQHKRKQKFVIFVQIGTRTVIELNFSFL